MACKHAHIGQLPHGVEERHRRATCSIVNDNVGVQCGMPASACENCKYLDGDSTLVDQMIKTHLANLLISGNMPRYKETIDIPAMAARFIPISTKEEREDVLAKAIECQSVSEENGGFDAETVAANLEELERELGLSSVLERLA